MAATLPFREALNKAIVSGTFVDTKIILFSRRDSSGRVHEPKALYASSHVLKSIPYFNDLLFGNFSEAELRNFDDDIGDRDTTAEDYGYYSDSDLEDDEDEKPMPPVSSRDDSSEGSSRESRRPTSEESPHENNSELSNRGRIVEIPDIACVTFQGFILYLYTGRIEFAPLGSRKNHSSGAADVQISSGDKISPASPKSVYRLADKYDVPALKNLALNCIRNELKGCDIVEEAFSEFASRYEDIKLACVTQLVSTLRNDTEEKATWMKVCEVLDGQCKVDHRHVTDTLSLLWGAVNRDESVPTTIIKSDDAPPPTNAVGPSNWNALQAAMVKSIREGIFLDRKYWTRYSKFGGVMKEIYFSSVVLGDELETRITRSHSKDTIMNDHVGDTDTESDCETDAVGTEDGMMVGKNDQYAVLSPGSYSAWRSLFFYICTGQTSFAPLRSQGADSRMRYILENTTADLPLPCSPKSIYILANLLNIEPLRNIAFEDIERKLSENNIVEEFFSCMTANQPEVAEMECRLLLSKFKTETTVSRAQEKINAIPENHLVHHAGAFKLGLRAALDRTRPDPRADTTEGVELRCYSIGCPGHREYIPYSLVTSNACPRCRVYIMQCVSCGRNRTENSAECGSCGKRFL